MFDIKNWINQYWNYNDRRFNILRTAKQDVCSENAYKLILQENKKIVTTFESLCPENTTFFKSHTEYNVDIDVNVLEYYTENIDYFIKRMIPVYVYRYTKNRLIAVFFSNTFASYLGVYKKRQALWAKFLTLYFKNPPQITKDDIYKHIPKKQNTIIIIGFPRHILCGLYSNNQMEIFDPSGMYIKNYHHMFMRNSTLNKRVKHKSLGNDIYHMILMRVLKKYFDVNQIFCNPYNLQSSKNDIYCYVWIYLFLFCRLYLKYNYNKLIYDIWNLGGNMRTKFVIKFREFLLYSRNYFNNKSNECIKIN